LSGIVPPLELLQLRLTYAASSNNTPGCLTPNRDRKESVRAVSHVVLEAFLSPPERRYYHVAHKDRDLTNNRVENLRLVHASRPGLGRVRKLTPEQVLQIRAEANTWTRAEMARRFGVSKRLVVQIILGTRWRVGLDTLHGIQTDCGRSQLLVPANQSAMS
jgi:hypothetical protein